MCFGGCGVLGGWGYINKNSRMYIFFNLFILFSYFASLSSVSFYCGWP